MQDLKTIIEQAWEDREAITTETKGPVREAVLETLERLDAGTLRVAGRELERRVDDLDPDDRNDVAALAEELERLGVEPALRAAGARPGDDILVGAHRFTFRPRSEE